MITTAASMRAVVPLLLSIASGVCVLAAFPPYGIWVAAPVGVALLALACLQRSTLAGAGLGFVHGLVFFVPLLHWTGLYVGAFPWLLLATFEALYMTLLGALLAFTSKVAIRWLWVWPLVVGGMWVAVEALRSRVPFGGFGWGRLAFSQADAPTLELASIGGAPLVTAGVALAGGFLAASVCALRSPRRHVFAALAVVVAIGVTAVGLVVPAVQGRGETYAVAVVQGNVPRAGLDFNAQRRQVLQNHVDATLALAADIADGEADQPALVIWPENSSDVDPFEDARAYNAITGAARDVGAPILVGAVLEGPGRFISNVGIVWDASGPGERYVKQHPVPFAEYVPYRSLVRKISAKVDLVRRDFTSGSEPGILRAGPVVVGDVICFEIAYDGLVATTVQNGAELLVVQTNNATFGRSAQSAQQLAMVRLRAVEHGTFAVMASTSGTSAVVNPHGTIIASTPLFVQRTLVESVTMRTSTTLATRIPYAAELLWCTIAVVGIVVCVAGVIRARKLRGGIGEESNADRGTANRE